MNYCDCNYGTDFPAASPSREITSAFPYSKYEYGLSAPVVRNDVGHVSLSGDIFTRVIYRMAFSCSISFLFVYCSRLIFYFVFICVGGRGQRASLYNLRRERKREEESPKDARSLKGISEKLGHLKCFRDAFQTRCDIKRPRN